ncbi:MAG: sigma-70 family RNA polymerase sigma factor [Cyanobacteria bacterium P01_H01_bin.15]
MQPRQSLIEQFSSFVQFEGDHFHTWLKDSRLRRHVLALVAALDKASDSQLVATHYYAQWDDAKNRQAFNHLAAYLQEACHWSAYKVTQHADGQLNTAEAFQTAIANLERVLRGYNPKYGSVLSSCARSAFSNAIKDHLRQRRKIDICSDWGLLRKVSKKRLLEALAQSGQSSTSQQPYVLAWQCFTELYTPTPGESAGRLAVPTSEGWAPIVAWYNQQVTKQKLVLPTATEKTLLEQLKVCAQSIRRYLNPQAISLNQPKQDSGELQDDLAASGDSLMTEMIQAETVQARQTQQRALKEVLIASLGNLKPELQQILQLYYQEGLTQSQITKQLGQKQYTISRRLTKARERLFVDLGQWCDRTLHISLESNVTIHREMNSALEAWLEQHWRNSAFLET